MEGLHFGSPHPDPLPRGAGRYPSFAAGHRGRFASTRRPLPCCQGRLRTSPKPHLSAVPSGLECQAGCFPALKRRICLACCRHLAGRMDDAARDGLPAGCRQHVWRHLQATAKHIQNAGLFSGCPSGTKEQGGRLFSQASNPIHKQCLQGHFAATVSRQEDVRKIMLAVSSRKKCGTRSARGEGEGEGKRSCQSHWVPLIQGTPP